MNTSTAVTTEQNNIKPANIVVRGSAREFLQDVVSGKHHLRADGWVIRAPKTTATREYYGFAEPFAHLRKRLRGM